MLAFFKRPMTKKGRENEDKKRVADKAVETMTTQIRQATEEAKQTAKRIETRINAISGFSLVKVQR